MAKTYYAWTNFPVAVDSFGRVNETIHTGDEVTRKQIPCTDEEWDEYIDRGMIRGIPYPDAPKDISPREFYEQPTPVESVRELRMNMGLEPPEEDEDTEPTPAEKAADGDVSAAGKQENPGSSATGSGVSNPSVAAAAKTTPPASGASK